MKTKDARTTWPELDRLAERCERSGFTVTAMEHIPRIVVRLNHSVELLIDRLRHPGELADQMYRYHLTLHVRGEERRLRTLGQLTEAGAELLLIGTTLSMLGVAAEVRSEEGKRCTVQWHVHDTENPNFTSTCRFDDEDGERS